MRSIGAWWIKARPACPVDVVDRIPGEVKIDNMIHSPWHVQAPAAPKYGQGILEQIDASISPFKVWNYE